jgi:hypothetical protein
MAHGPTVDHGNSGRDAKKRFQRRLTRFAVGGNLLP